LQAPARELDQVLLQRLDAESVRDPILVQLAVRAVGADIVRAVLPEERGGDLVIGEGGVVEVAEDVAGLGGLHGAIVVRALVLDVLPRVTRPAGLTPNELGPRRTCRRGRKQSHSTAASRGHPPAIH